MVDAIAAPTWPAGPLHPAQRRYLAEDLVRLRRSDEQRRYAAPQRAARIDPNPHQIEAVIFALGRVRDGGCILADEVGLGKTIETGLVIAQLLAEGASRFLLVAPKPLLGQWKQELFSLFDIEAREGSLAEDALSGAGVFLVGRELAGSEKGKEALIASGRFDLCVIDEAHEVFAGIYKRVDKLGDFTKEKEARTAARLRDVLAVGGTPVLLLTATPIQNNLAELWGLVQYVDPLGTLLGDLPTFRAVFCGTDDRQLARGQEEELRSRLKIVLQRTLRRQAKGFLDKPFVDRQARLFEYTMSVEERALYDDVTRYLLEPGIVAFQGRQRQLLLIGFHRRMASSTRALAASLQRVADRLRRKLGGPDDAQADADDAQRMLSDLEESDISRSTDPDDEDADEPSAGAVDEGAIRTELARVEAFVRRAELLVNDDGKFRALLKALTFVTDRARDGRTAGKLVIFTESLVTQEHIRERLIESGLIAGGDVTIFRGTNNSPRAHEALKRWREEVPQSDGPKPGGEMAMKLALVHEFKTRSQVFISTEAGAKGLNLQFCDTLVNYDLPWNPQRIEQRIGRCHRYGQKHEVTVINFLAKDNEAQQLTFEILSQKLDLFGTVLDASDQVLHQGDAANGGVLASALGAEFEAELRRVWDRARTLDEVTAELRALRERVADERKRFEETHARTANLIQAHLDDEVQRVFRRRQEELPHALADLDRDLVRLATAFLDARGLPYERVPVDGGVLLVVPGSPLLPVGLEEGVRAAVGSVPGHGSLHMSHPLVIAAISDSRARTPDGSRVAVRLPEDVPAELQSAKGKRGRLRLVKLAVDGFERIERLLAVVLLDDAADPLSPAACEALLRGLMAERPDVGASTVTTEDLDDAVDAMLFEIQSEIDGAEQRRFDRAAQQAERFVDDRLLVLRRRRSELTRRVEEAQLRRDGATGSEARSDAEQRILEAELARTEVDAAIERLEQRDDVTYRTFQEHIQKRRYSSPRIENLFELELVIE